MIHANSTLDDLLRRLPTWASHDQGRLHIDREFLPSFESRGWTSFDRLHSAGANEDVHVFRRLSERENARASLGPLGNAYLKRHFRDPYAGLDEARAILLCAELGIKTARLVAFGSGQQAGTSLVMTQALDEHRPADQAWHQFTPARREALLVKTADLVRRLHECRLFHRDLYWCHFFVKDAPQGGGEPDVRLIDLQRVFRPASHPWRWRLKDLGQFLYSAPAEMHRTRSQLRWWKAYRARPELTFSDYLLIRSAQARAWAYRIKEGVA